MSDHYDRDFFPCVHLLEHCGQTEGARAIQRARGFIGEQDLRPVNQCAGNGSALAFTAGQLSRTMIEPVTEPDGLQQLRCTLFQGVATKIFPDYRWDEHIFQNCALRQKMVKLKDEANGCIPKVRQLLRGKLRQVLTRDDHFTRIGLVKGAENVQEGAFSTPARADDGDGLALANG